MIIDKPIPELLDRSTSDKPDTSPAGDAFRRLTRRLERDMDAGTHVLSWIREKNSMSNGEAVAATLFRHVLDNVDAASILVKMRVDRPCLAIARSALEAWFSLEYLLESDTERRARCYIYCNRRRQLDAADRCRIHCESKEMNTEDPEDRIMRRTLPHVEREYESLKAATLAGTLGEIDAEFERLRSSRKRRVISWYSLYDGPNTISELAARVNLDHAYKYIYKSWSESIHAESALQTISVEGVNLVAIEGFRNGFGAPAIVQMLHAAFTGAAHRFVECVLPKRKSDFGKWYLKQGRTDLEWISGLEFSKPTRSGEDRLPTP